MDQAIISLWQRRFKKFSYSCFVLISATGLLVLLAWQLDFSFIHRPLPGLPAMNPTTALCFLFSGVAALLIHKKLPNVFIFPLLAVVLVIGSLRYLEMLDLISFQVDSVLYRAALLSDGGTNRMAGISGLNFIILSCALAFSASSKPRKHVWANNFVVILFIISLFSVIGYIYRVKEFYGILTYVPMSVLTGTSFILAALGVFLLNSGSGFMRVLSGSLLGSHFARILIPCTIVIPILLGFIRLSFQWRLPVSVEFGVSILITSIIFVFLFLIGYVSYQLNKADRARADAERRLILLNQDLEQRVISRSHELVRSGKRFQALVENSSDAILMYDRDMTAFYQSPAVERITGISLEERKNYSGASLTHPEDKQAVEVVLKKVMESPGKPIPFHVRLLHKEGNYIWIEGYLTNLLEDETVQAVVGNYIDITIRKESERKLREEKRLLRILIDHLPLNIYVKDLQSRKTLANKSEIDFSGAGSESEVLGKTDYEIYPEESSNISIAEDQRVFSTGKPILNEETLNIKKDGTKTSFLISKIPLKNEMDELIGLVGISFDITERKAIEKKILDAEKRYRLTLDSMIEGCQIIDFDWRYVYVNPTVAKQGRTSPEKLVGRTMMEVYPGIDKTELFKVLKHCMETRQTKHIDNKFEYPDGSTQWFDLRIQPSKEGLFILSIDITDQKLVQEKMMNLNIELEERVKVRTEQLQVANKELESFTYSVSHDLRAPLRIIDGFGQILMEDYHEKLDKEGQRALTVVMNSAKKMGQLIDDLLNFSRMARTEIRPAHVDMNSLVAEVLDDIRKGGTAIPEKLTVSSLPAAMGDERLIRQVWVNLISNAIKYSGKKPDPQIEIGVTLREGQSMYFVKDNGAGFDMEFMEKLFGVFQRLHRAEDFPGTGVGLAIVKRILLRHGGDVHAEAKLNEGATFFFFLPEKTV